MKKQVLLLMTGLLFACSGIFILLFYSMSLNAQNGIDISHHNNLTDKDWAEILKNNVKFVYIKASEGKSFKDPAFKKHYNQAKKHKLLIGAYHFYNDNCSPESQFNNFINSVKGYELNLIPVIDFETGGFRNNYNKYNRLENLRELILLFYDYYNVYPIIYTDYYLYNSTYSEIKSITDYFWINCGNKFFSKFIEADIKQYRISINKKEIDFNTTDKLSKIIIKNNPH